MKPKAAILNVPTNVITGFLGTGKTSAILHLLAQRPDHERWAVLVNEFGEIGVDGSLFESQHRESQGVFVRQVPGGCMCCTAGLPMQVALNELLRRARPDRLLIEPTGLGHPNEVLGVLAGDAYRGVLAIQKIITLVDARHLADGRFTELATYNQQIAMADLIVGNKADLYGDGDRRALEEYAAQHGAPHAEVFITERGAIETAWLRGATRAVGASHDLGRDHGHDHPQGEEPALPDMPVPKSGYLKAENEGEGFRSVGWRFSPTRVFDRQKLLRFLQQLQAERMKAVFRTDCGAFGYNLASADLTETALDDCPESRIEILAPGIDPGWEEQLMACVTGGPETSSAKID
ncbi:MAG: GTP-binding protein [bacterium]|nr:GTP-binding protein [bacterium]